jgi:hypothetical protein
MEGLETCYLNLYAKKFNKKERIYDIVLDIFPPTIGLWRMRAEGSDRLQASYSI